MTTGSAAAQRRLYVLDTNVLMHDPASLFRFQEHDILLPMIVLEELDQHKKGLSEQARNVRQVSRHLDEMLGSDADLEIGLPLPYAQGRLYFQTAAYQATLPEDLAGGKADHEILAVTLALQGMHPDREVILVSKDINLRIKGRTLGIRVEDYHNDRALEDADLLYTGVDVLSQDFWEHHSRDLDAWQENGRSFYRLRGPAVEHWYPNQFIQLDPGGEQREDFSAIVRSVAPDHAIIERITDYGSERNAVWGIRARNREQNFALALLLDPEIDFISILGPAGTGKTLLTLAAALQQIFEEKRYAEAIITRATVPVGDEIGFLPGTEEEKMQPWMGAIEDNLEILSRGPEGAGSWGRSATQDLISKRLRIKSMSFMRGRTFLEKFVIIDEAQNLTPKEMKTLITRAGPGTKVVCLGNIAQIDTPYLTETTSGLTYVVDRFKKWEHSGHITLRRGERSRLADYANEAL
ncbi:PhoH family protein [Acidithiobacillus sp. CV18-2]|uniref:PhoH family protein n=1 Tax=Igneacidithiobacillus copahuensis TaxID=2724909 RepID=A0AAE2YS94_9PROT|nr:PhoH family protein [Igneacidithiobacillus copahuensis]MBU2755696.1 PhoH family protein [Acidithiobacillus sp. CV18-3]MBU2757040.1 PhoH family protein [Acidithiobacillus sp. BN09-2]MBU2778515.1 PhoH family protein [Acidithiobacillus sp. CV18-2]MBU2795402.1 PhoH family protein [Acidithiobacillus sp. VAN18-2]MBU2798129.1 PhoH family protein [Acidithiobacillus sp. VAN18-4]UTV82293.1 PhoH family protein [Acidithiobacillus sp. YTS05]